MPRRSRSRRPTSGSRPSTSTVPSPQGNGSIKGYLVRRQRRHATARRPSCRGFWSSTRTGAESAHRGHRAAVRAGQLHGVRARRAHIGRRLPGRRRQGRRTVRQGRSRQDGRGFVASALWLKSRADCTGKIGVTGFCFGGGIANTLAVRMGADLAAAAPFYGGAPPAADVPKIKAAILVHHGETRHAAGDGVAGVRSGAEGRRRAHTKGTSIRAPCTASTTTRRPPATTKPRPIWRGSARSTGSTNTCVGDGQE